MKRVLTYTAPEMLRLWLLRHNLEPLSGDTTMVRTDGIDLATYEQSHLDAWYAQTLLSAPIEELPLTDVKDEALLMLLDNGAVKVDLPARALRVADVKLVGWDRSARIVTPDSAEAAAQTQRFSRARTAHPVAVDHGAALYLYSAPQGIRPELEHLRCVAFPPDGEYHLTPMMLERIPELFKL